MNVVITGGTGFIGSNLARKLNEDGQSVTVTGREPESSALPLPEEVERKKLDVTDPSTIDFEGADVVIHLVGLSPLFQPSISYKRVHVDGTRNVVQAAEQAEAERFIHMSALGADPEADTEYLRTKGEAEKYVREMDTDHVILRPSVIFGEGDEFVTGLKKATKLPILPLPGGGRSRFQPIHVGDISDIFAQLVESGSEKEILEIGGPEKLSMREIAARIRDGRLFVLPIPMFLVLIGLALAESIPFVPFGLDQYRSLKIDNTVDDNDAEMFLDDFTTLEDYLD